jgi:hypothetical protein
MFEDLLERLQLFQICQSMLNYHAGMAQRFLRAVIEENLQQNQKND